jgi:hypothetical protein
MRALPTIVLVAAAASQLGATDCGQAVRDPGFDLWCGPEMCAWKVERGDVERVATWNEGDPGVELVGDDVAIEQLSPVASSDGSCLEFDMIANIDPNAQVKLNIDVFADGLPEYSSIVPTSNWKPLSYRVQIVGLYSGIRFELAKTGSGRAQLASIGAKIVDCTDGIETIMPSPAPNGARCDTNAGCRSGICGGGQLFENVCVGCTGAAGQCAASETCGVADPTSPVYVFPLECEPTFSRSLGENCLFDRECVTNICTMGACSTCRTDNTGCAAGEGCGPGYPQPSDFLGRWNTPYVCSPGAGLRLSGQLCATDDDCAGSHCAGDPRMQCTDGRRCATAANCPFGGPGTTNGLQNGPCDTVGVQGGICQ